MNAKNITTDEQAESSKTQGSKDTNRNIFSQV